jgi:uncharacterized membrane protein required for colicin V production
MSREEFRLILFLILAWFLYRSARRKDLNRAVLSILTVVLAIAFGVFVVYYGKLWHAWIPKTDWHSGVRSQ